MLTKEELEAQLKTAIRKNNALHKRTIRMILAEWQLAEIDRGSELDEQAATALIQKQVKARREAISDAEKAGRTDIVQSTQEELEYLLSFLPQPLRVEELEELARQSIQETGVTDPGQMGLVMKVLMPRLQGRADGKQASELVRALLSSE